MPARRFWMMDRQIDRIRAENDIRLIQINGLTANLKTKEQVKRVEDFIGQLTLEIGEKLTVRRNVMIAPEPGAAAKFNKLVSGGF